MKAISAWLDRHQRIGLILLRVGIGAMFIAHGWPKLFGGPAMWANVGGSMKYLGITFAPTFWGLMAALAETGGGVLLVVGFFVRPASAMMLFTMIVATVSHLAKGDPFSKWSHPVESGVVFLALLFLGAGGGKRG